MDGTNGACRILINNKLERAISLIDCDKCYYGDNRRNDGNWCFWSKETDIKDCSSFAHKRNSFTWFCEYIALVLVLPIAGLILLPIALIVLIEKSWTQYFLRNQYKENYDGKRTEERKETEVRS